MDPTFQQKIDQYSENAFKAQRQKITDNSEQQMKALPVLGKGNSAYSPYADDRHVRLYAQRVNDWVLAKATSLMDAYEIYGVPLDGRILQEAASFRIASLAGLVSGVKGQLSLEATRTGRDQQHASAVGSSFERQMTIQTQHIMGEVSCEIERRKASPKFTKQEVQQRLIFISCGQYYPKEIQLGKELLAKVQELTTYDGYFAENQNSLEALSSHIFRALDQCAAIVAVMHHRGEVEALEGKKHKRASVWIEQEIAIAAFITATRKREIPVLLYIQNGIKREGVREQLKLSPIFFDDESEVVKDFDSRLRSGEIP